MAVTTWTGATGQWNDAADWSNGVPRSFGAAAQFTAPGTYTVSISRKAQLKVGGVDLNATGATLALDGSLTLRGTFDLATGTLAFSYSGVLHGGVLMMDGGTLSSNGGTLDSVHVVGPLTLAPDFQTLNVTNGLTVATGTGAPGVINLDGELDILDFVGDQTFDSATIVLNTASIFGGIVETNATLTLGAQATITTAGSEASGTIAGKSVINDGTVHAAQGAGIFTIESSTFVNNGALVVDNVLEVKSKNFTNGPTGTIAIGAGQNCLIEGGFSNQGMISVGAGSQLLLSGQYTAAGLGTINNLGVVVVQGVLSNQGSTVTLGAGPLAGNVIITGTIEGGTVIGGSDLAQLRGATLDDVTYQGDLILGTQFASVTAAGGLTVTRVKGSGPGRVVIDGSGAALFFSGSQTFDNATVRLGGGGPSGDSLTVLTPGKAGMESVLTLGANLTVVSDGNADRAAIGATFGPRGMTGATNDGTIRAAAAGGAFTIDTDRFTNNGAIVVANGDQFTIASGYGISNTGTIDVASGASLVIGQGFGPFSNSGAITVAHGGALTVGTHFTLASLGNISNAGTFVIGGAFDNTGAVLQLGTGPIFGGQATVLRAGGLVQGGTVVLGKAGFVYSAGELAGLTVDGAINLGDDAILRLGSGVVVTAAGGAGPGVIDDTGAGAELDLVDSATLDNVTITVGNATTASKLGLFTYSKRPQTATFGPNVTIVSAAAGALVTMNEAFAGPDTIANDGVIEAIAHGGAFNVTVLTFLNNGQAVVADGDTFAVHGKLAGTGHIDIATGGILEVGQTVTGQTVDFTDATGTLKLDSAAAFAGAISGASVGDTLDLVNTAATAAAVNASDQLVIVNHGVTVAQLQLVGDYSRTSFSVGGDGAGGSVITLANASAVHGLAQAMAGLGAGHAAALAAVFRHDVPARATALVHPFA